MPWQECDKVMKRMEFIVALQKGPDGVTFAEVCRTFGISRPTGYKWLERFEQGGPAALEDRRPIAVRHALAIDAEIEDLIVAMRRRHPPWGPRKLRRLLKTEHPDKHFPAASTVGDVLSRRGLIVPRRRRVRYPPSSVGQSSYAYPNAAWCIDYKGAFAMRDGGSCAPLTLMDGYSRYLLDCVAVRSTSEAEAKPVIESAMRMYGMPWALRSDGGPPFATASTPGRLGVLSVWLVKLGIELHRNWPAHPEQNPRLERYHGTLEREVVALGPFTWTELPRVLDAHRREYNEVRPHDALGECTPASAYSPSPRAFPSVVRSPEYGNDRMVRRTDEGGRVCWRGHVFPLGVPLAREPVFFDEVGDERWNVYFGRHYLLQVELLGDRLHIVKDAVHPPSTPTPPHL